MWYKLCCPLPHIPVYLQDRIFLWLSDGAAWQQQFLPVRFRQLHNQWDRSGRKSHTNCCEHRQDIRWSDENKNTYGIVWKRILRKRYFRIIENDNFRSFTSVENTETVQTRQEQKRRKIHILQPWWRTCSVNTGQRNWAYLRIVSNNTIVSCLLVKNTGRHDTFFVFVEKCWYS